MGLMPKIRHFYLHRDGEQKDVLGERERVSKTGPRERATIIKGKEDCGSSSKSLGMICEQAAGGSG